MKKTSPTVPYRKNDLLPLVIEDVTSLGSGVGHTGEGVAVFVPGTVPGDTVLCRIIKCTKSYLVGKTEELRSPSPHRVDPGCAAAGKCGGCSLRMMDYESELALKEAFLRAALRKERLTLPVLPILTAGKRDGYRNKVQYPVTGMPDGSVRIGYYAPHSHRVVPSEDCPMHHPALSRVLSLLRRYIDESGISGYREETHEGLLRHLFLRTNHDGSEIAVCLVINGDELPEKELLLSILREDPAVKSVWFSVQKEKTNVILGEECHLLAGKPSIEDTLLGMRFGISLRSFYQVNHDGCEILYKEAAKRAALRRGDRLLDLYCGIGSIGICLAGMTGGVKLTGVEICPEAVENAGENAVRNGIRDAEFLLGDADRPALPPADVVTVDPPRSGLAPELIPRLAALSPRGIVYISCAPDTLARDLRLFRAHGYTAGALQPVDMFPGTGHVETVCLLSRTEA